MRQQTKPDFVRVREEFESLLSDSESEQEIHSYLQANPCIFAPHDFFTASWKGLSGILSKFPITPDRIPDFTLPYLSCEGRQSGSRINFLELKRPSAIPFVERGRMSKDLNDAWAECQDTLRMMNVSFDDVLRRMLKHLIPIAHDREFRDAEDLRMDVHIPKCYKKPTYKCFILIGRRANLKPDDLLRLEQGSEIASDTIKIATYDFLLDELDRAVSRQEMYAWW